MFQKIFYSDSILKMIFKTLINQICSIIWNSGWNIPTLILSFFIKIFKTINIFNRILTMQQVIENASNRIVVTPFIKISISSHIFRRLSHRSPTWSILYIHFIIKVYWWSKICYSATVIITYKDVVRLQVSMQNTFWMHFFKPFNYLTYIDSSSFFNHYFFFIVQSIHNISKAAFFTILQNKVHVILSPYKLIFDWEDIWMVL